MKKLLFLFFLSIAGFVYCQDAQFRGSNRDGVYPDKNLLKEWPADGPKLLMTIEGIGGGYSSAVVSNGVIFVTGKVDTIDNLSAISLNGNFLWKKPYGRSWTGSYPDTRVTPTVEDNRVYVMNGTGTLYCFNAKNGEVIWSFDVDKTYEAKWHRWGVAENPLIIDDKIICTPCGAKASVVALDKMTGKPVWQSPPTGGYRSYVAPVIYKYKNFRYILASTYQHLLAVDPQTGAIIWQYAYNPNNKAITINSPIYKDDEIYMSNGYDYRSAMIKMAPDGKSVTEKWLNETLDNHHHGMVVIDNYIYGSNWLNNTAGNWVCLNWDNGEVKWEQDWYCKGPIVAADGMLYIIDEKNGNVGLVKPNPEKFELVSTFKLVKGKGEFWAHPTINDGKLYIRYNNNLMVYDIRKK